jgi:hypothetical protein
MRVPEEPVCVHLFRQKPVFTSLHLKSPVHVHRLWCHIAVLGCLSNVVPCKAVVWGDKRTRRLRVLALWENHRRVRVRVLAFLENPRRDWVLEPALRENPRRERVLDRWFQAQDSSVDILILGPWIKERGRGCPLMGHEPRTMDLNYSLCTKYLFQQNFAKEKIFP